jgi:cytochrome d ubiquinol oxidase subunit I
MDSLILARWQFAITTIYHYLFVPLTLGLSIFLAVLETKYVLSKDETYKKMVKFWGKIFLINFAIGVVTGIVQEFQFGLNWSEYSRFMGDIFGAPLAIEALLAFYLESTFIGMWHFGWDKLPRKVHAATMWLVAIGTNVSALWILIANSFMQHPVGYAIRNGRAEMTDFWALIGNTNVWHQFPHALASGIVGAGFLVMAFSAYHLLRKQEDQSGFFYRSFRWATTYALIGSLLVISVGHVQGQFLVENQPLKMAAAEAIWETEQPAAFSVVAGIDEENQTNTFDLKIPSMLSFLSYNNFTSEVEGIKELQAAAEEQYGSGDYIPPVALNYWSFRIMVGLGFLMLGLSALGVFWTWRGQITRQAWFLKILMPAFLFPTIASTAGWILTETGRWPWIVYGLQRIEDAVSPNVTPGNIWFSMIAFTILYGVIMVIGVALALKYGKQDPTALKEKAPV